jgi:hypothetical protein
LGWLFRDPGKPEFLSGLEMVWVGQSWIESLDLVEPLQIKLS